MVADPGGGDPDPDPTPRKQPGSEYDLINFTLNLQSLINTLVNKYRKKDSILACVLQNFKSGYSDHTFFQKRIRIRYFPESGSAISIIIRPCSTSLHNARKNYLHRRFL